MIDDHIFQSRVKTLLKLRAELLLWLMKICETEEPVIAVLALLLVGREGSEGVVRCGLTTADKLKESAQAIDEYVRTFGTDYEK